MRFCQSERAIKAREWRATQREKRRFDTLLSDYAKVKYQNVYKECTEFYRVLIKTYPKKHDLTKTKEYRRWKNRATDDIEISHGQSSDEEEMPSTPTARQSSDEAEIPSTPTARQGSDEAEMPSTPTARQSSDEAEMPSTPTARQSSDEAEPSMEEPVQNLIQLAAGDLIPDSPEIRNNLDNIIDDIVRELQEDADIRDMINAELNDEDEGIGLNVDTELEAVVEPFDYQLEMEGVDW